jgi:hypothetical protein
MRRALSVGCALLLLTGALGLAGAGDAQPRRPGGDGYSAAADRQCRQRHGDYRRVCMLGRYSCVTRFADAGRRCRSSSDCQGRRCLYRGPGNVRGPVTGQCVATSDPCGCFTTVENGRIAGGLCVD